MPASTITSGSAQASCPFSSPSTTSSVTAPPAMASGAITRAARRSDRTVLTPAPTSAAANGASSET